MPSRVSFPLALLTTLAAIAVTPAAAFGTGWTTPKRISAEGAQIAQLSQPTANNRVAAAPDGSVVVAWAETVGGYDVLRARRYSASTRTWSDPLPVSDHLTDDVQSVDAFEVVMDTDGNATLLWAPPGYASATTSTLLAGASEWSQPETLASGGLNGFGVAKGPSGTVVAGYIRGSESDTLRIATRARNATTWDTSTHITIPSSHIGSSVNFDFNASHDGAVLFFGNVAGDHNAYVARYSYDDETATGTWLDPTVIATNPSNDFNGMADLTIAPNGDVAAMTLGDGLAPLVARVLKASGTLAPAHELGSGLRVMPMVVADSSSRFIAAWETLDFGAYNATEQYSISEPGSGTWSDPAYVPGGENAGASGLVATEAGDVKLVSATGVSMLDTAHITLISTAWSIEDAAWSAPETIGGADATIYNFFYSTGYGSAPTVALSDNGDLFTIWSQNLGSTWELDLSVLDASGPSIDDVSVPASALVNTSVDFSARTSDLWSAFSVTWTFALNGDQANEAKETGSSVSHAFANPGTYTVTVSATDAAGNATTQDAGTITVTAPPPVVKEKTKLPPVIPARLAGKKITITTTVPNCSSKFVAITKFGTTKYQTKLKLTKNGKLCTATGTIVLKKAPSARTKLRVAIGRVTKTGTKTIATLTTKRS